jgi:hypothetical protein
MRPWYLLKVSLRLFTTNGAGDPGPLFRTVSPASIFEKKEPSDTKRIKMGLRQFRGRSFVVGMAIALGKFRSLCVKHGRNEVILGLGLVIDTR